MAEEKPLDPKVREILEEYPLPLTIEECASYTPEWFYIQLLAAEQYERERADAFSLAFDAAQKQTMLAEERAYDRSVELKKERERADAAEELLNKGSLETYSLQIQDLVDEAAGERKEKEMVISIMKRVYRMPLPWVNGKISWRAWDALMSEIASITDGPDPKIT